MTRTIKILTLLAAMIITAGQTWADAPVNLSGWGYNVVGDPFPEDLNGTKGVLDDGDGHTIPFTIHNYEQATGVGTDNVTVTPRGSVLIDPEDYANKPAGTYTGSVNGIALSLTITKPAVPIVVTSANINDIFCGVENATDVFSKNCLGSQIHDGDILDIQGFIDKNRSLVINKRVGIISSTKNATINLHTIKGGSQDGIPEFSFIVSTGATGSVIKDLFIWNTQTWIYDVKDVLLKDVTISVRSIGLSEIIGHTAIRFCDHLVMDGCNVFSENTSSAPNVVFYVVNRSSIINTTIEGQGSVGSLLTLECPNEVYDVPFNGYVATSTKNTIKNCAFKTGYPNAVPILANDNVNYTTIDGIQVNASKIIQPGQNATVINSEFFNGSGFNLESNSTAYNNVVYGSGSAIKNGCTVYNNTFKAVTISGPNVTFQNNTVNNKLTVSSSATIKDNFLNTVEFKSGSNGATLTSNVICGQVTVGNNINVTSSDNATTDDNTGVPATATADDNMGAFYYVSEDTNIDGDITISKADGAQSPKVTFLIADGAHLTVSGGVSAPDVQMNVYPLGSGQMTVGNAIKCKGLNIYGGTVTAGSIAATGDIRISNCQMAAGNIATATDKDIRINECKNTATGNVSAGNIFINGGQVSVNGTMNATNISFGWTHVDTEDVEDEIFYIGSCSGNVTAKGNQRFVAYNTEDGPEAAGIVSSSSNINISGKYLRRLNGYTVRVPDGITLGGYNRMFTVGTTTYYVYGIYKTVTVNGHEADLADIHVTRPSYGENEFNEGKRSFYMPAQDIDITAVEFYNYGFNYIGADGTEQTTPSGTKVYILDGTETALGKAGTETWYVCNTIPANEDDYGLEFANGNLTLAGDVHLILGDNSRMTVNNICGNNGDENATRYALHIYGQHLPTANDESLGQLVTVDNNTGLILFSTLAIHGGSVICGNDNTDPGSEVIQANVFAITGGHLDCKGCIGNENGTCDITLDWTSPYDCYKAYSFGGNINIAEGKLFYEVDKTGANNFIRHGDPSVMSDATITPYGVGGYCGTTANNADGKNLKWDIPLVDGTLNTTMTIKGKGDLADNIATDAPWKDYTYNIILVADEAAYNAYKASLSADDQAKLRAKLLTLFGNGATHTWSTFCAQDDYQLPSGCTSYELKGVENGVVTVSPLTLTDNILPAYVPVMIHRSSTGATTTAIQAAFAAVGSLDDWTLSPSKSAYMKTGYGGYSSVNYSISDYMSYGYIKGSDLVNDYLDGNPGTTGAAIKNVINYSPNHTYFSFYNDQLVRLEGDPGIAIHRCVLELGKTHLISGNQAPKLVIEGETTGISDIKHETLNIKSDNAWYTLDGRMLSDKPNAKGIYIRNGVKAVVK